MIKNIYFSLFIFIISIPFIEFITYESWQSYIDTKAFYKFKEKSLTV